jgi:hypothetical protein
MLCSGVALEDAYGWVAMKEHCLWKNEQTHNLFCNLCLVNLLEILVIYCNCELVFRNSTIIIRIFFVVTIFQHSPLTRRVFYNTTSSGERERVATSSTS